jgi:hypothetical protein
MDDYSDGRFERLLQSTLFWGSVSAAITIVIAVVAAMEHDVRWILIFALPMGSFAVWEFSRTCFDEIGMIWGTTLIGSLLLSLALLALYFSLAPRNDPSINRSAVSFVSLNPVAFDNDHSKSMVRLTLRSSGNLPATDYAFVFVGRIEKTALSDKDVNDNLSMITSCLDQSDTRSANRFDITVGGLISIDAESMSIECNRSHGIDTILLLTQDDINDILKSKLSLYIFLISRFGDDATDGFWQGVQCQRFSGSFSVSQECGQNKTSKINASRWP